MIVGYVVSILYQVVLFAMHHFPRYYHVERSENFYYIAMELAIGTLYDFVSGKKRLDHNAVLRDMSTALQWLHSKNISKLFPLAQNMQLII